MVKYNTIDYFCGPGGFSKGFEMAGYNVLMGIDYDENSINTFQQNHNDVSTIHKDITEVEPERVINELDIDKDDINIIIGGPPCQGFSLAGDRDESDKRNQLFREYAHHIDYLEPDYFVMENVPGMLSMETEDGVMFIDDIQRVFSDIGYETEYQKLLASDFGVPQNRERVFIIGSKNNNIRFPSEISDSITVGEAISDLPSIEAGEKVNEYDDSPINDYQRLMRRNTEEHDLTHHDAVNHQSRIVSRFEHIPQGGDMTDAPEELQPSKVYSSRNRRLSENKPSYTVTSHVLDEFIHPNDDRALTVRESARLQSFPDDYTFSGKRNVFHGANETSQYEQIGNAVPPLLGKSIAKVLLEELDE